MKYLIKYIKTLSDNITESESNKSCSRYYVIDGSFKIRVSDHIRPSCNAYSLYVDIVKIWDSDDFIVFFKKSLQPIRMDRKKVKDFVKFAYDTWKLDKAAKTEMKNAKSVDKDVEKMEKEMPFPKLLVAKYPSIMKTNDFDKLHALLGKFDDFKQIPKETRNYFRKPFQQGKINAEDIVTIWHDSLTPASTCGDAEISIRAYLSKRLVNDKGN
ncbi:MAG: hypothetical protein J6Y37_12075 [Paludibacteraceae bacterium]|nr:hypothetical protein [Paludibacteraceae bacterium]